MFVPLGALCFVMALFVVDAGLPDDKPKEEVRDGEVHDDERRDGEEGSPSVSSAEVSEDGAASEKTVVKGLDTRVEINLEKLA